MASENGHGSHQNGHRSNGRLPVVTLGLGRGTTIEDLIENSEGSEVRSIDIDEDVRPSLFLLLFCLAIYALPLLAIQLASSLRRRGRLGALDLARGGSYRRRYEEDEYEEDKQNAVFKGYRASEPS